MAVFSLPTSRLADAQTLVARFARKAAKLGMPAPALTELRAYRLYWLVNSDGYPESGSTETRPTVPALSKFHVRSLEMTDVEVTGERPVLAGWSFAAVIEATPAGNILHKSPRFDGDLPERFRACTSECDHCQKIRTRTETFVVYNDAGEFKQVGRSCLKDFVANTDPAAWLAAYAFERDLHAFIDDGDFYGEGLGGFRMAERALFVDDFLSMVAAQVRELGYVSAAQSKDQAEWSVCPVMSTGKEVLLGATDRSAEVRARYIDAVTDADRQLAADAVAWATSDAVGQVSDYVHNVRMYIAQQIVNSSSANTLASLVQSYRKHLGMRAAKANKLNEHLPGAAVKQRLRGLALTLVGENSYDTDYGTKWVLRFEDSAGRAVVWKTTSARDGYGIGDAVVVTGTVKALGDYRGTAQTELSRCSVAKA